MIVFAFPFLYLQWAGRGATWLQNPSGKSIITEHIENQYYSVTVITLSVCKNTTDPQCVKWDSQCNNDWREGCQNISRDLWPHLNITLEHYNDATYGIAISWEQPGIKVSKLLV